CITRGAGRRSKRAPASPKRGAMESAKRCRPGRKRCSTTTMPSTTRSTPSILRRSDTAARKTPHCRRRGTTSNRSPSEAWRSRRDGPFGWVTDDLRAIFLVGPKTGHSWHPESRAESNAFINKALETAGAAPDHVRFVTYTTRFNQAHWLTVDGLEETY